MERRNQERSVRHTHTRTHTHTSLQWTLAYTYTYIYRMTVCFVVTLCFKMDGFSFRGPVASFAERYVTNIPMTATHSARPLRLQKAASRGRQASRCPMLQQLHGSLAEQSVNSTYFVPWEFQPLRNYETAFHWLLLLRMLYFIQLNSCSERSTKVRVLRFARRKEEILTM